MESLSSLHTFAFNARCRNLYTIESAETVSNILHAAKPFYMLGEGSNTVFVEDFDGAVVLNKIKGVVHSETPDEHQITVGAGENWHGFVTLCMQNGWHGMENLALIPGSVGAAPIQNIGAYGVEVKSFIKAVLAVNTHTGERIELSNVECDFSYRSSVFKSLSNFVITHVTFSLRKNYQLVTTYADIAKHNVQSPHELFAAVVNIRQNKLPDPAKIGNVGSFFKNPIITLSHWEKLIAEYPDMASFVLNDSEVKVAAAWLIDTLGFKRRHIGGVRCHHNQPLVLINDGTGTGQDLLAFSRLIKDEVREAFNITLEAEARLVGKEGLIAL